jgi:hypothetical protein
MSMKKWRVGDERHKPKNSGECHTFSFLLASQYGVKFFKECRRKQLENHCLKRYRGKFCLSYVSSVYDFTNCVVRKSTVYCNSQESYVL